MKSINLHLVVAGATYFTQLDRFQGWSGTPLTQAGQRASLAAGQQLRDVHLDTAFTSDTSRGVQTGQAVLKGAASTVTLQVQSALRAPFFGGFEGMHRADIWSGFATKLGYSSLEAFAADQTPSELQTLIHDHDSEGLAESGTEFWRRYWQGLRDVWTATPDHGQALIVVDEANLRELWYRATGERAQRALLANSSYVQMRFDGDNFSVAD